MIKEAVKIGMTLRTALSIAELYDHIADNGTSNMDSCIIELDNTSKTFIEIVNEICGGCLHKYRENSYWVQVQYDGQAFKRTKKAEVVCDYLKSHGINAHVEYTLD